MLGMLMKSPGPWSGRHWRDVDYLVSAAKVQQGHMLTDRLPKRDPLRSEYFASDKKSTLELPSDDRLRILAKAIEAALLTGKSPLVRTCAEFLAAAADFYNISTPPLRVLAARPIRVYETGHASELFGDYDIETTVIRVWMRTGVKKQVTSYGTFLATLCHEFCHHLDFVKLGFHDSPHTRGFYERTAALYHHARNTPPKKLIWTPMAKDRWRIDWPRTNRREKPALG